jgi:hypothetical protein
MANKEKQRRVIKHILHNNKYDVSKLNKPTKTKSKKKPTGSKWAKFTYVGKETKLITKLFKDSSVNITFTTQNAINKLLSTKPHPNRNKFENNGISELTCPECEMKYVGQTGRSFRIMFSEHFLHFKYANDKSKFSQHLLENNHSIGPIENIMSMLYSTNERKVNGHNGNVSHL